MDLLHVLVPVCGPACFTCVTPTCSNSWQFLIHFQKTSAFTPLTFSVVIKRPQQPLTAPEIKDSFPWCPTCMSLFHFNPFVTQILLHEVAPILPSCLKASLIQLKPKVTKEQAHCTGVLLPFTPSQDLWFCFLPWSILSQIQHCSSKHTLYFRGRWIITAP